MTRTTRPLKRSELDLLLKWAATEGWNPGLHDAEAFWAADPNGFFGAFVGENMVAGIAAVAYGPDYGFIGLYICDPDCRGQGHGKAVWDAAMTYLGARTIGLDAVPEQQANYARMGFVASYETVRMTGVLPVADLEGLATDLDPVAVAALDRLAFPAPRPGFLAHWMRPPHIAFGLIEQELSGYAVSRLCQENTKIGPIFASSPQGAIDLLRGFEGPVQLDVPVGQASFLGHLESLDFTAGFRTTRMYKGHAPSIAQDMVFAVTSLELG
jgi:GNAT superfamily N-acetyltransferase